MQLRWFGPLYASASTLTSYYVDAVVEWDTASGAVTRLLAPKRADTWAYAVVGEHCVNLRCDGALTVHVDGCLVSELKGHQADEEAPPVRSIVPVAAKRIASLGHDGTVRLWDVAENEQLAMITLPSAGSGWAVHPSTDGSQVVASALDGSSVRFLAAEDLEEIDEWVAVPATVDGWRPLPDGGLVGASSDDTSRAALTIEAGHGSVHSVATRRVPTALATAPTGTVAIGDLTRVLVLPPDAAPGTEPRVVQTSMGWCHALTFSPDGKTLYTADGAAGVKALDVETGESLLAMERPE